MRRAETNGLERRARRLPARWLGLGGLLGLLACAAPQPPVGTGPTLFGHYSDLAESEWSLELVLERNGHATVETAWWGESGREIKRVPARWRQDGELIRVRYGGVTDTLRYHPRLSMWGTGKWGRRPGLEGVPPIHSQSLIGVSRLWSTTSRR